MIANSAKGCALQLFRKAKANSLLKVCKATIVNYAYTVPEPSFYRSSLREDFLDGFQGPCIAHKLTRRNQEEVINLLENDQEKFKRQAPEQRFESLKLITQCLVQDDIIKENFGSKAQATFIMDESVSLLSHLKTELDIGFIKHVLTLTETCGLSTESFSEWFLAIAKHQVGKYATSLPSVTRYCLMTLNLSRYSHESKYTPLVQKNSQAVLLLCKEQLMTMYKEAKNDVLTDYDSHYYLLKILFVFLQSNEKDIAFTTRIYSNIINSNLDSFQERELTALLYNTQQLLKFNLLDLNVLGFSEDNEVLAIIDRQVARLIKESNLRLERVVYSIYSFCKVGYYPKLSIDMMKTIVIHNVEILTVQQVSLLNLSLRNLPEIDPDQRLFKALITGFYTNTNVSRLFMPDLYYSFYPLRNLNFGTIDEKDAAFYKDYIDKLASVLDQKIEILTDSSRLKVIYELINCKYLDFKTYRRKYSNLIIKINLGNISNFEFLLLGTILRKYLVSDHTHLCFVKKYVEQAVKKNFFGPVEEDRAINCLKRLNSVLSFKVESKKIRNNKALETLGILAKYLDQNQTSSKNQYNVDDLNIEESEIIEGSKKEVSQTKQPKLDRSSITIDPFDDFIIKEVSNFQYL